MHDLSANFDTSYLLELDGHYYLVVDSAKTYADATAYAQTLNLDGYSGYLAVISTDAESQFVYENILVPNQYRSPDSSGYGPADFYYFGLTRIDGEWLFEHPDGLQPVSDALTDPWATTNFTSDANRTVAALTGDSYIPGSWEDVYRSRGEWIAFGTTGSFYSIVEFEPIGVGFEPQVVSFDLNEPGSYFYGAPMNNGGVIAVWENSPVHDGDIVYQRFNIDGTPSDNKVVVADDLHTHVPAIAELKDGSVVVTYVSYDYSVGRYQAAYKIFDDQDLLVTEGLLSNTLDDYNGIRPVALESGDFFISYRVSDNFPQTSGYAQGFQFFDSAGVPDGNEIIIPQPLGGGREAPVVHSDNTLAFLWASSNDLRLNIYELSTLREGSIDDALIADQVVYSQSDQLGNYELLKSGDGYYVTFGESGTFYIAEYASDGSLLQAGSPIVEGLSSAAHMQVVDLGLTGQLMVLYSWQPDSTVYETYAKIVSTDGFTDLSGPQKVVPGQLNTDADLFFESGTVFFSTHDGVTTSTHGILFNVAPEFDQTSYLTSVDENITTGSFTLTTNVLDPENDPLVYSLSGPDNGYFVVDPDTGVISLTVSPDYESKSSYDLVIEVSDGFSVATAPISVEVIDGNDEPEGSVAIVGYPVVGEYVTLDMLGLTDDDGGIAQVLSYHWYRDGEPLDGDRTATSDPDNKQLQVREEDVGSSLSVEITYIDGRGFTNTVMSSPTTPVLDRNDPPEFVSPSLTLGIDENVSTSMVIFDADATDPDGDSLTYSLQGDDAGSFAIDGNSGEVRFNESPDYETHASYDFTVTASDGELYGSVDVTVSVNNVNEAPLLVTDALGDQLQRPEIELAQWSSDDGGNDHFYGIKFFDSELYGSDAFREFMATQSVQSDFGGHSGYVATITSPEEQAFIDGALGATLAGIWGPQAMIGATDLDDEGAWRWFSGPEAGTLLDEGFTNWSGDSPDNDWMWYKPDGEFLIILDYKTEGGTFGGWNDGAIQSDVRVTHPYIVEYEFASVSATVDENVYTSTIVFDATATDPDGDSLTYSLQGTDAGSFTIDGDSGQVRFDESPDYETHASYDFTVIASDGELSGSVDVTVNINDINDSPLFATDVVSMSVDENVSTATVVYDADATDADGDDLTYSVSGVDADKVTIDPSTGELRFNESPDYESGKTSYEFTVTASDGSLADINDVTLDVTDVNEAPQLERLSTSTEKISILNDSADIQITPYMGYWSSVALADGTFAVAWSTTPPSGGSGGIYFQRVSDTGQPIETPLLIDGSGESGMPEMLALPDGTIVLSYTEYHSGYRDIEIRHIDSLNNVIDPGIANTDSTGDAYRSHLADLGTGAYVASWTYSENHPQILPSGGFAQLIDYDGTFIGDRFAVIPEEPSNHLVDTVVVDGLIVSVYRDASAGLYGWSTVDPMEKSIETSTGFEDANSVTIASVDDGILATWSVGRPDTGDGSTVIYGQKFGVEAGVLVPRGVPVVLLDNAPGVFSVSGISPIISGDSEVGYAISWIQGDDINAGITHAAILDTDLNVQSEREVLSVPTGNSSGTSINADPTTDDDDGVDAIALARDLGGALYLSTLEFGVQYKTILEVAENSHESVVIHGFEASDPESDDLLFSLSGSDADYLWIDPETGDLRLLESADFETKDSYEFTVTASDGALSDSIDVTLEVTDEPETIPLTDRVVISMSGATYPVDTWELTLVEQTNSGELQTYVITAGDFSITGSNIQNAANAFVDALNAQLPDGLTVVNLTADSLTAPQLIEITGSNQFAATLRVESGTGATGSVYHGPVVVSDPATIVSLQSDSPIIDVVGTFNSFAALHEDGSVSTWGPSSNHGDPSYDALFTDFDGPNDDLSVVEIHATWAAFAGLRSDGSVVVWGEDYFGGDLSPIYVDGYLDPSLGLTDVVSIDASYSSFSVIRADGSVVTWGQDSSSYDVSIFEVGLAEANLDNPPVQIVSNDMGDFAALLTDGSVVGWGSHGITTQLIDFDGPENNLSVESIVGSYAGFHAIRTDGSVVEWGSFGEEDPGDWHVIHGLDLNGPNNDLAFSYTRNDWWGYGVGIRDDGSLAISAEFDHIDWNGPDDDLTILDVVHNSSDSLLLRSDGSVIPMRDPFGIGPLAVESRDASVDQLIANLGDFAAVLADGSLIPSLWFTHDIDANGPHNDLTVSEIKNSGWGFAAILSDGSVLSWINGGPVFESPDFNGPFDDLVASDIYSNNTDTDNFAAVLSDGSVVSWGTSLFGSNDPVTVYENRIFQYQVRVMDPDQESGHIISVQSDTPWLTVDQESMVISGTPDQVDVGHHTVELLITDNDGLSTTQMFDVLVRDVNQAPEFLDDQIHVSIPEQSDPNHPIHLVDAFDPDGDVLTYQLDGMDAEYLSIDSQSGEVRLLETASYLVQDQYQFEVIASDGELKDSTDVRISVDPFFDTAAFYAEVVSASKQSIEIDIKLDPSYLADQDLYLESFQFGISPADGWDTFSNAIDGSEFAFDWGEGYDSLEGLFQSLLYNAQPFDKNVGSVGGYAVFLDQQDAATPGVAISDEFTLGRLTLGPAVEGTYLIELNNGSFQLSGIGEVAAPDISVIVDVKNNAPILEFNTTDLSVQENGLDSELIYSASANDIDLDHLQYFLTGTDSALLDIDSETGDVYLVQAADFETKDVYHFSLGVTDGDLHDLVDLTLNVQDSNDATDGVVTLNGAFKVGEVLELDWSGLSDQDDGIAQIQSYRWYRDGEPLSLESVTAVRAMTTNPVSKGILLTHEDIGSTLSVEVTYLDGRGYSNTIMSEESVVVSAGDYQPLDKGVYFDGTVVATSDSLNFGADGEGTTLITLRPDHQAGAHSVSVLKAGSFDVNLDFDGGSGYAIRVVTASGDELTTQTLMTGEETTFAIRYLAVEGELELITPNEHVSMIGAGWETPMLDAVIGEGYQGFISQIVNHELRDPEIDLLVLRPGDASEEAPNVRELFRLTDLDAGTRSVEDDETAYGSHLLEFSEDVKSGGYHKPEFINETTTASVEENYLPDSAIFEVSATDDDGDVVTFSLIDSDHDGLFSIDPVTGQIFMHREVDYEHQSTYDLTVEAFDSVLAKSMDVTVQIVDVDEYRASGSVTHWKDQNVGIEASIRLVSEVDQESTIALDGSFSLDDLLPANYEIEIEADPLSGRKYTALDALMAMKIAVGLIESNPYSMIAADVNQNGRVTSADALDILKMAVDHGSAPNEQFVFIDQSYDVNAISKNSINYPDELTINIEADAYDVNLVGVLLGDVDGSYSNLI